MLRNTFITLLLAVIPNLGSTQSLPEGFYLRGNAHLENFWSSGSTELFRYGEATLGYRSSAASSIDYGIEIRGVGFDLFGISTNSVVLPAIWAGTPAARVYLGSPKTAFDEILGNVGIQRPIYSEFHETTTYLSLQRFNQISGSEIVGLRFDGQLGDAVRFGISGHRNTDQSEFLTFAGTIGSERLMLAAGGEIRSKSSVIDRGYQVVLAAKQGPVSFKLAGYKYLLASKMRSEASIQYRFPNDLSLTAMHNNSEFGYSYSTYTVEYELARGAYLGARARYISSGSDLFTVFGGWNFSFGD